MICHSCYSIIHKFKKTFTIFPSSVPQVHKKCRKIVQNEKCIYLFPFVIDKYIYFLLLFSKGKYTDMDVYRADVTFLIPIGEMDFFLFIIMIILCCIIGYCVISVSKGSNK